MNLSPCLQTLSLKNYLLFSQNASSLSFRSGDLCCSFVVVVVCFVLGPVQLFLTLHLEITLMVVLNDYRRCLGLNLDCSHAGQVPYSLYYSPLHTDTHTDTHSHSLSFSFSLSLSLSHTHTHLSLKHYFISCSFRAAFKLDKAERIFYSLESTAKKSIHSWPFLCRWWHSSFC